MKNLILKDSAWAFVLLAQLAWMSVAEPLRAQLLIDVDFGGGSATSEVGPAAIGHSANLTVTASFSNLLGTNVTCYFRVRSSNFVGPNDGAVLSFARSSAPPVIKPSLSVGTAGSISLSFSAAPGRIYRVQASSDLLHWTTIGTATETASGSFQFAASDTPAQPSRFYRLFAP